MEGMLELIDTLASIGWPTNQAEDWMIADCFFSSTWRLAYTSSRTFARYRGLSGWGGRIDGVTTPELRMRVARSPQCVTFEEPLSESAAFAIASALALPADEAAPSAVLIDGTWRMAASEGLNIQTTAIRLGSRNFKPADGAADGMVDFEHEKAVRVLGATTPVYLDAALLVLRAQADGVVFVWESLP